MAKFSVSKLDTFVSDQCTGALTVGVDVHKKNYSVSVLGDNGVERSWTTGGDPWILLRQLCGWKERIKVVAYEAGPTGFELARILGESGIKVIVAAPSRIPRPVRPGNKTDRLDCMALARYAQKGMLKSIAIPSRSQDAKRGLARRRSQISRAVRRGKQRIRSFLLYNGIKEPSGLAGWSKRGLTELGDMQLDKALRYTLDSLMLELQQQLSLRQVVDLQLKELLEEDKVDRQAMACMQSIPGVGFVTASQYRLEIFNPSRFNRPEEVTSLVGLAPVVRASGGQKVRSRLSPAGKKELRSLLVEVAWILRAKEKWARQFYDRVWARTRVAQKAIVALARKLCIILWRICVELRPYKPVDA